MKYKALLLPCLLIAILQCCTKDKTDETVFAVPVSNIYKYFSKYNVLDSAERINTYIADSTAINAFMKTVAEQTVTNEILEAWANSRVVEIFTPAVDSVFEAKPETGEIIGRILSNAEKNGIALPSRQYANVVYGRPESILFVDSIMLVSLNHYLGADYPGYSHWPTYIRDKKTPEMLPYDLAEALVATEYPFIGKENATVLSRLIYEGALAHAKDALVGHNSPAMSLGYSESQFQWLIKNEKDLWRSLVHNRLIYDTSEATIYKLVGPAPSVSLLNPETPGRAGRFIGYRIVDAYMKKHPEKTLSELLSPDFYNSSAVLMDSGY